MDAANADRAILALDLATTTGWAIATPLAVAAWPVGVMGAKGPIDGVTYGSITFGGKGRACLFLEFSRWLDRLIERGGIGLAAIEAPVHARTMPAMRIAGGLAAISEMICAFRSINSLEVPPTTVKKHFTGSGAATKPQMMAACDARGWLPPDNNAGDALAVLDWAVHSLGNNTRISSDKQRIIKRKRR